MSKINAGRSRTILKILQEHYDMANKGNDKQTALTDLLADVYHFAAYHNIELEQLQRTAYAHFSAERQPTIPALRG
jgi:hypothetical protein